MTGAPDAGKVFHVKQGDEGRRDMTELFHVKRIRQHWRVYGAVQGVGFREFTRRAARDAGLDGYVRNHPDGSVEIEAEGTAQALRRLEDAVRSGPPFATVRELQKEAPGAANLPHPFAVRY
jgi:acylphosphatase